MGISEACVLVALLFGCTRTDERVAFEQTSILGGVAAAAGEYPVVAAVRVNGTVLCGGTLVSPDLVLTAADCLLPSIVGYSSQAEVTAATTVVVNTVNVNSTSQGQTFAAADTIPHPSFDVSHIGQHDIALIRLADSVTDITPSPINRVHDDAPVGVVTTQLGFGVTTPGDNSTAGILRVLTDKPSVSCQTLSAGLDSNLLCFDQVDGTGSCDGDSGGPAFIDVGGSQRVAGVGSFGDQDCARFGAYSRVDAELDFLDTTAPELACQTDGFCTEECGQDDLPDDPDCPECAIDDDCGSADDQCVDGACIAKPNTPGGLGYECTDGDQCDSALCATVDDVQMCSEPCDPDASQCPDDFDCVPAGEAGMCWPADDGGGGCSATGTESGSAGVLLWLLLSLVVGTRRRAAP